VLLDKDFLASFAFLTTFGQIFALFGGCVSHLQTTEKDKLSFLRSNFAVWNGQTLLLITFFCVTQGIKWLDSISKMRISYLVHLKQYIAQHHKMAATAKMSPE